MRSEYLAKYIITYLSTLGVKDYIISPGSRSAPLVLEITNRADLNSYIFPDERSAAYVALGMSQQKKNPVAMVSTSGTAALNYSPAIAEAFYQHIPIIAITADRPIEWIDQMDGQTVHQENMFDSHLECKLLLSNQNTAGELEKKFGELSIHLTKGPCHINVSLEEPLYKRYTESIHISINRNVENTSLNPLDIGSLKLLEGKKRILIIIGQGDYEDGFVAEVNKLIKQKCCVVYHESLSNLNIEETISIDECLLNEAFQTELKPDICISMGGPILSKRMKEFMRQFPNLIHWRIDDRNEFPDTFRNLKKKIDATPVDLLKYLFDNNRNQIFNKEYCFRIEEMRRRLASVKKDFLSKLRWSDMFIYKNIVDRLNSEVILHCGNSSVVRYMEFFQQNTSKRFSNRGTSGIDGCVSTAVGASLSNDKLNLLVVGDMSFVYDSNAFWSNELKSNLRIIVINNKGGHIFSLIDGPEKSGLKKQFFESYVPVDIEKLCLSFGLSYIKTTNNNELVWSLNQLFGDSERPIVLELETNGEASTAVWRDYLSAIKNFTYEKKLAEC